MCSHASRKDKQRTPDSDRVLLKASNVPHLYPFKRTALFLNSALYAVCHTQINYSVLHLFSPYLYHEFLQNKMIIINNVYNSIAFQSTETNQCNVALKTNPNDTTT